MRADGFVDPEADVQAFGTRLVAALADEADRSSSVVRDALDLLVDLAEERLVAGRPLLPEVHHAMTLQRNPLTPVMRYLGRCSPRGRGRTLDVRGARAGRTNGSPCRRCVITSTPAFR